MKCEDLTIAQPRMIIAAIETIPGELPVLAYGGHLPVSGCLQGADRGPMHRKDFPIFGHRVSAVEQRVWIVECFSPAAFANRTFRGRGNRN